MSRRLKIDLLANYASLAILASSGLIMNLVIVRVLGDAALGTFNQVLAIYTIGSQLAVGGVHYSVLRAIAQASEDRERSTVVSAGVGLSLAIGLLTGAICVATRHWWAEILGSPGVAEGLLYTGPALVLISLNKTLLGAINGLQRMRLYALLQSVRYVSLVAVIAVMAFRGVAPGQLALSFVISEALVFVLAAFSLRRFFGLLRHHDGKDWVRSHFNFGAKGLLSGVFIELNTRVDVLMLGFFLSDADVGRYSFAAIFAEGLNQVLIVVRNNMNPMLAQMLKKDDRHGLVALVRRSWRYVYPGMIFVALAGAVVVYFGATFAQSAEFARETTLYYGILAVGIFVVSGFTPFDGVLLQAGLPGWFTIQIMLVVLTNIVAGAILIPLLGTVGAALGTALALVCSIFYLTYTMKSQLGYSFFSSERQLRRSAAA